MRHRKKTLACAVLAAAVAGPALAHHSFAMFDLSKSQTLVGTIKEVQFTNPHVWFQVMAPGPTGGAPVEWSIEAGAPGMLLRTGWKPATLKPGDKVSLVMHPGRSGKLTGSLVNITTPDGKTLGPGGPPPAPGAGG